MGSSMLNNKVTKGRILIGAIIKVKDDSSNGKKNTGKVQVRIPEFHGPLEMNDLPEEFKNQDAYYTPDDKLPWIPVCFPLGYKYDPDTFSEMFFEKEMVYISYTDDQYQSPVVIGTTGRPVGNSITTATNTSDIAPPLFGESEYGEKLDFPGATEGAFDVPIVGWYVVTSPYGRRWGSMHIGIDLAASMKTKIRASLEGVVIDTTGTLYHDNSGSLNKAGSSYGNMILIQHNKGGQTFYTRYAHLYQVNVVKGQSVTKEDIIGLMGSTGSSTGPHLHFEIMSGGASSKYTVDPAKYLVGLKG